MRAEEYAGWSTPPPQRQGSQVIRLVAPRAATLRRSASGAGCPKSWYETTIDGLSPAISIDQKTTSRNPRSTVGTVTEIYDYLRLLYARVGRPHCPVCGRPIAGQSLDQIVEQVLALPDGTKFNGPAEFRRVLVDARKEMFVSTVADRLLTYALGRGLEAYDAPVVRRIVGDAAAGGYRFSSLVLGVVTSTPFQMRRAEGP